MRFRYCAILLLFALTASADAQLFRRWRIPPASPRPARPAPEPDEAPTIPPTQPAAKTAEEKKKDGWGVPVAAQLEIARRGNLIEELGTGHRSGLTLFAQAMGPPADDSGKWYLSVVAKRDDEPSLKLLADFKSDPNLRAFVSVDDFNQSWSHFNTFWLDDQTQKRRWEKIKLDKMLVTLVQPPWNKTFGPPQTVVMQENGYSGNAEGMAVKIRRAIEQYVHRMATVPRATSGPQQETNPLQGTPIAPQIPPDVTLPPEPTVNAQVGYDAPFKIPLPVVIPDSPERIIPRILPNLVPQVFSVFSFFSAVWFVVKFLFGSFLTNLLLFLILLALVLRGRRRSKEASYDLVVDTGAVVAIAGAVKSAIGSNRSLQPGPPVWLPATQPLRQGQVSSRTAKREPSKSTNPKLRLVVR